jgi:hypothetical protein
MKIINEIELKEIIKAIKDVLQEKRKWIFTLSINVCGEYGTYGKIQSLS